jgi:hypothetical protein
MLSFTNKEILFIALMFLTSIRSDDFELSNKFKWTEATLWAHQLSCWESSIFLSVYNLYLFPSSSCISRLFTYRQFNLLFNRCYTVVLKTCYEVMFFISAIPSEIRRFKFAVRCLFDDHTAAYSFVVSRERFSTTRYDSLISALSKNSSF